MAPEAVTRVLGCNDCQTLATRPGSSDACRNIWSILFLLYRLVSVK